MEEIYDLAVIGGGPGGYSIAIAASKQGMRVILFERNKVGGTCLNVGCIPVKYLLDKASMLERIRELAQEGILKDVGLFSYKKIKERRDKVVTRLTNGVSSLLEKSGVKVVLGEAKVHACDLVSCSGEYYKTHNVVIATGSKPASIPVPNMEIAFDSTGILQVDKIPKHLAIIGGGVIGLEFASVFKSFGSQVTVLELLDSLLMGEQKEAVDFLLASLKKREINIMTGVRIKAIEMKEQIYNVLYIGQDNTMSMECDAILCAAGRKPELSCIDAEKIGIELEKSGVIKVNEYMETNVPHIYAIGDVRGGYQLAHAAYAEGEIALSAIRGNTAKRNMVAVPRCIYTIPAFASVGINTDEAFLQGIKTVVGKYPFEANGMAMASGETGVIYVVIDERTKHTLGVYIVGGHAQEMISLGAAAVDMELTIEEWEKMIITHPSISEGIREAALAAFKKSIHV